MPTASSNASLPMSIRTQAMLRVSGVEVDHSTLNRGAPPRFKVFWSVAIPSRVQILHMIRKRQLREAGKYEIALPSAQILCMIRESFRPILPA
jgi:hypothetical protein